MQLVLEGNDVFLLDDMGYWYPLELRRVTVGDGGLTEMLGLVKQDARRVSRGGQVDHSHTTHIRPL